MAVSPIKVVSGAQVATASAVLYTASGNLKITAPTFTNTTAAVIGLTIAISYGGAAARTITSNASIAAGSVYLAPELSGQVLGNTDAISAFASATGVNAFISGISF